MAVQSTVAIILNFANNILTDKNSLKIVELFLSLYRRESKLNIKIGPDPFKGYL